MTDSSGGVGTVDRHHLLLVGAGPGLGIAIARRFAVGGYRVTLVARSADRLGDLADSLSGTGAVHIGSPWQTEYRFVGE